jgi:predicted phosphodiesterase
MDVPDRFALIADIHGNILALEAVLHDILARNVETVFDLGDVAQGSLEPGQVVRRLRDEGIPSIRGNTDRLVIAPEPAPGFEADHAHARRMLSEADIEWMAEQPTTRRMSDVLLCHGTPSSDSTGLLETITPHGARTATDDEILSNLGRVDGASLIGVAHTHVPRVIRLFDGRLCVNPGSVGLPAYEDDAPFPHAMEAGSPHARYAVITRSGNDWSVELVAVPYEWESAAHIALERGRADRAHWIRTGRARR